MLFLSMGSLEILVLYWEGVHLKTRHEPTAEGRWGIIIEKCHTKRVGGDVNTVRNALLPSGEALL